MSSCTVEEHLAGDFLKERRRQLSATTPAIGSHPRLKRRIGHAVTQEEVAEAVGVSRVWYALIEAGRGDVSPRLLSRIADALMLGRDDRLELLFLIYPGFR